MTLSRSDGVAERPVATSATDALSADGVQAFHDRGYIVLPAFLSRDETEPLMREVDSWLDDGLREASIACCVGASRRPPPTMELEMPRHGSLVSHPPLMGLLRQLMGPVFAFHHMHSTRHDPDLPGKDWHHDYEQQPQAIRTHVMVHALHYLSGLDGSIGDLVVLPGSHRIVAEKGALKAEGTGRLPGEVVIDDLPPGSTVLVHSALFHARRAKPAADSAARYFIDASYCQGGVAWPAVKPFWVGMLDRARDLGLDRGRWPDLFERRHFYEPPDLWPLPADPPA